MWVARPQNNTNRNYTIIAENKTNRKAETAMDPNAIEVVYGVKRQSPQLFASVGHIFFAITAAIK